MLLFVHPNPFTSLTSPPHPLTPSPFTQALIKQWERYAGEVGRREGHERVKLPSYDKVLLWAELVLDEQGELQEVNRVHGENEVRV